jgi:ankyrin repeat protein
MTAQSGKGDPSDHLAVAELLLRHGACLNIADDRNRIPLDYAREQVNHSPEFVQLLQLHAPPVFKAIQEGDLPTLTNLLASVDTLSELNNSKHNGVVALVWSIEKLVTATEVKGDPFKVQQYYLILKELMDRGANPDQQAREGDDPPLFQLLQALRQTLKKQLDEYSRVLKDTIVLLVETGGISITPDSQQLLHQATRRNEIQFAQFMIEKLEIDPNLPGRQGITALQFASRSGQIAMVNYLLSLDNIQVDATDETGQTALDAARVNGKETIIQAIEDYMKLRRLSVTIPS